MYNYNGYINYWWG